MNATYYHRDARRRIVRSARALVFARSLARDTRVRDIRDCTCTHTHTYMSTMSRVNRGSCGRLALDFSITEARGGGTHFHIPVTSVVFIKPSAAHAYIDEHYKVISRRAFSLSLSFSLLFLSLFPLTNSLSLLSTSFSFSLLCDQM